MLSKILFALSLASVISIACRHGAASDGAALQGTWLPTAAELGGTPFPDEVRKTIKLTVEGETYVVAVGPALDKGTVRINPGATPKEMEIIGTDGPNKGKSFPAIYELSGDQLRICYDLSGTSRPAGFATQAGTQQFLVTYVREKP